MRKRIRRSLGRRLDVDVRRPLLQRLAQDQVDVLDDRRVLDDRVEVGEVGHLGRVVGAGLRRRVLGGERGLLVVAVDARDVLADLAGAAHDGVDVAADHGAKVVDGEHVGGIGHPDDRRVAPEADRQHPVAPSEALGHELDGLGIELELVEVDELHADLVGHRPDEVLLADEPELGEDLAEGPAGRGLLAQRRLDLLGGDLAGRDQRVDERRRRARGGGLVLGRCGDLVAERSGGEHLVDVVLLVLRRRPGARPAGRPCGAGRGGSRSRGSRSRCCSSGSARGRSGSARGRGRRSRLGRRCCLGTLRLRGGLGRAGGGTGGSGGGLARRLGGRLGRRSGGGHGPCADGTLALAVHPLDVGVDLGRAGDDGVDVAADDRSHVVHRHHVVRSGDGHDGGAVLPSDRETRGAASPSARAAGVQPRR